MGRWARRRPLEAAPSAPVFGEAPQLSPDRPLFRNHVDSRSPWHGICESRLPRQELAGCPSQRQKRSLYDDIEHIPPFYVVYPPTHADFAGPPANPSRSLPAPVQAFPGAVPLPAEVAIYRQQSAAEGQKESVCGSSHALWSPAQQCSSSQMYENDGPHQVSRASFLGFV